MNNNNNDEDEDEDVNVDDDSADKDDFVNKGSDVEQDNSEDEVQYGPFNQSYI